MKFDEEYTKYWSSTVNKSVDGTIIAGVNEAKNLGTGKTHTAAEFKRDRLKKRMTHG